MARRGAVRNALIQGVVLAGVVWLGVTLALNAHDNLARSQIAAGFGFLERSAGFGINQTLIPYSEADPYWRVFIIGLLNTILVSVLGIVFATVLGFLVGIGRLSTNWLVARLASLYVEALRNLPLLFQILFWYLAVLAALPGARQSLSLFGLAYLNNRGLIVPYPDFGGQGLALLAIGVAALAAIAGLGAAARRQRVASGQRVAWLWPGIGAVLVAAGIAMIWQHAGVRVEWPELRGFNFVGGMRLLPELVALVLALSTYTASFIAEIVRAGISAVPRGQSEAAAALGLKRGTTLRLIIIPQALRVIVPPLTSQYLNLLKNSSLAVAIGYPDLFSVFAGTTLNNTGQAIEVIALTMAVYLVLSLATSLAMNLYNARLKAQGGMA